MLVTADLTLDVTDLLEPCAPSEPARRDRPLDFHWRVPKAAAARTGWTASGDRDNDRAMRSAMAALVLARRAGEGWVSYSRRRTFYSGKARYEGTPYTYDRVMEIVEALLALGLIEEERALPGDHRRTGRQSRMKATDHLVAAFAGCAFEHSMTEVIRLRDRNGHLVGYADTNATRRMRSEIETLNACFAGVRLELPGEGVVIDGEHLHVDGATLRMTPSPQLYRVFSRSDFSKNGRLQWWGQSLPSKRRADLLIDGEGVVELDYTAMHPHMLYAKRGIRLDFDPYDLQGFSRPCSKLALLVLVNAQSRVQALEVLLKCTFRDGSAWPLDRRETRALIAAAIERNQPIAGDFFSDAGIDLMNADAGIALRVVQACAAQGIACLPVHDSFIVQRRHEATLQAIMDAELRRYEVSVKPAEDLSVNIDKQTTIPHMEDGGFGGEAEVRGEAPADARPTVLRLQDGVAMLGRPGWVREKRQKRVVRTMPKFDQLEASARLRAFREGRTTDYVPVAGEVESLLFHLYGTRTGDVLDEIYRQEDWCQRYRAVPVQKCPGPRWSLA